ncbi:MAG: transglutaminase domain-containing protein [Fermentimonas sp.]|nr:transglutaminase domain-containing protein [Fermentimonas sp.]
MKTTTPCTGVGDIKAMFADIMGSHPQFYYVNNQCGVSLGLTGKNIILSYRYSKNQLNETNSQIETVMQEIISANINQHQSDYDKVLVLHDYLKKNIQYDWDAAISMGMRGFEDSHNIVGAFLNKKCVCEGFAKAMKALCDKIGLECLVVSGTACSSVAKGPHAWNIVKINGYYHHVDVTWDNQFTDDVTVPNYGYLNLDDETIGKDHTWNKNNYPLCPDDPYNYFRVNQSLIDSKTKLEKFFYESILNEEEHIIFKVVKGSQLEKEIAGSLQDIIHRASSKCRHVSVNGLKYNLIPEQLTYMVQPKYQ